MGEMTYYVVQPYMRGGNGRTIIPIDAQEAEDLEDAMHKVQHLRAGWCGAVAFSRTGRLADGEWRDAVIHHVAGDVPEAALEFEGAA